jgi:hypothetical protein
MIERYGTMADYCATPLYQRWLAAWSPPQHETIDVWHDSEADLRDMNGVNTVTPRQHARQRHASRLAHHLLDTLEIGTHDCVDIGCGDNWFKRTYPGLWGVDPHYEHHRDELLTPEWYIDNWGQWPHAFSCNAMHFCDQDEIHHNIAKVRGVLRPHGTAVITLNRARIADRTPHYDPERLFQGLAHTAGMTRMVWFDTPQDASIDGNVWIWLRQ